MEPKYKLSCSSYLSEYINEETTTKHSLIGWYHYIDNPEFHTVGVVATAEILILLKKCKIGISIDCQPVVNSLLSMQNRDGGWSFRSNILKSATEPTARAIQALLLWDDVLDINQKQAIEKGIIWLLRIKNKSGLWGPVNKIEKNSYTYFSCVVLQCFQEILQSNKSYISAKIKDDVFQSMTTAICSILGYFKDSDTQCGWGITNTKNPSLFHTAYVVYTLLQINLDHINKHQIRKSIEFLKSVVLNIDCLKNDTQYNIGENEIYQYKTLRLVYTHSVDVYLILALLQDASNRRIEQINKACQDFINCAERTDWRYRGFVTCWRLFDIILLCDFYTNLSGGKEMKHFKVAFTFAGESRTLVESIAEEVSKTFPKNEILYDKYHEADFARPQLDLYLQELYHNCSDLIVVFICENYREKKWCGIEWRSIRDILNNFNYEKIMYIKASDRNIDDIDFPGFYGSEDGYIDASNRTPEQIADLIIERYNNL